MPGITPWGQYSAPREPPKRTKGISSPCELHHTLYFQPSPAWPPLTKCMSNAQFWPSLMERGGRREAHEAQKLVTWVSCRPVPPAAPPVIDTTVPSPAPPPLLPILPPPMPSMLSARDRLLPVIPVWPEPGVAGAAKRRPVRESNSCACASWMRAHSGRGEPSSSVRALRLPFVLPFPPGICAVQPVGGLHVGPGGVNASAAHLMPVKGEGLVMHLASSGSLNRLAISVSLRGGVPLLFSLSTLMKSVRERRSTLWPLGSFTSLAVAV
mmetsp:Transcript_26529/g.67500  ORF Transcript_26529/g.67500 Transcript_26529/m.67500 type:complete len:268 (+) Transcript_26529:1544-2347(+)